jgi:ABC-type bacteriocin/lantibiotic exporter with double-glycine peptidase domain
MKNTFLLTVKKFQELIRLSKILLDKESMNFLILSTIVGIMMALIEYVFVFYLQNFFSVLGIVAPLKRFAEFQFTTLNSVLLAVIVVGFLRFIFQATRLYTSRMSQQLFCNLQRERIISLSLSDINMSSSSESLSIFNDEVQRGGVALMNLSFWIISISSCISLLFILISMNLQMSLISFVFLFILVIPSKYLNRIATTEGKNLSREWGRVNLFFINGIRNNFYLRVYNLVDEVIDTSHQHLRKYLSSYKKTFKLLAIKSVFPSYLGLVMICCLGIISTKFTNKENAGIIISFFYIFLRFAQEASGAMSNYTEFAMNLVSLENIARWYKKFKGEKKENKLKDSAVVDKIDSIDVSDLYFAYDQENYLLKDLNINLKKGDGLVIVGASGTGKSTFLSLVLGLLSPKKGSIKINGNTQLHAARDSFIKKMAYVGPIPFMIEGTLRDNLLYANPDKESVKDAEIYAALELVDLMTLTNRLEKKLDTVLDENANTVSSGQKQRIMMARALIRKPELLILDEATSNLDSALESKIVDNLLSIRESLIIIAVTHREEVKRLKTQSIDFNEFK